MADTNKYVKKAFAKEMARSPPNLRMKTILKRAVSFKNESLRPLEELVQCGICLEKLTDPRMLPCQHTFCLSCLQTHLIAKNLKVKSVPPSADQLKFSLSNGAKSIFCPMCQREIILENGFASLEGLPQNLYINSLLKLLENNQPSSKVIDYRCVKCQTVSESEEHVCQHCMQVFCAICWNKHISELDANLSVLIKRVEESRDQLKHKGEIFSNRCDQLTETIKDTVQQKILQIQKMETKAMVDVSIIKSQGDVLYKTIEDQINSLKEKIQLNINENQRNNKITTYMNIHRETAKLFEEIYHYGEARIIFDPQKLKIDQDVEGIYSEVEEKDASKAGGSENPYESINSMVKHYRSRSFIPKLLWTKCPKPGGVGIPPWDTTKIYIAATDSHNIFILDRTKFKLVGRINNPEMLYAGNLAFSKEYEKMFVTDKWKHCVHVFASDGDYMRNFSLNLKSPEGLALGPNDELIICDTGNNRIVVANSETGELLSVIGNGILHIPTSVAVHGNNVIVADTGNNQIKIFNLEGSLLMGFGSLGRNRGEFRSAEVVTVDCMGFIFVGDGGNARIQVFQPDGSLVKIFGSKEGFGWISGIHVTPELDIITTDGKKKSLRIF